MRKFSVINTFNSLIITKQALEQNVDLIKAGHRFDHCDGGHEEFVEVIYKSLSVVSKQIEKLKK